MHPDIHRSIPPSAALRAFEVFGRVGGIRKTAKVLSVDHAVISRHLKALEAWIGTALINRDIGERESWLTADGKAYHRRVSEAMSSIASATDKLRKRDQSSLHIWSSPGFAFHWLSRRLKLFRQLYPDIEIELRPSDRGPDFSKGEADGDIRYVRNMTPETSDNKLRHIEFARPDVFPVASPNCIAALETAIAHPANLLNTPLLHEDSEDEWRAWFTAQKIDVPERLPGLKLWHAHLTLDAARDGQGIALVNHFLLADDLAKGTLSRIVGSEVAFKPVPIGGYHFIAPRDRWNFRSISLFREWLQAETKAFDVCA